MRFPYTGGWPKTSAEQVQLRQQVTDFVRQRGTAKVPIAPSDPVAQSGSRGVLLTWGTGSDASITGWRIYNGDESTLYMAINNRGTRQAYIPTSSGSSPQQNNFFISSINSLGVESQKVQIQGKATAESGAPSVPSAPGGFSTTDGADRSFGSGSISRSASGSNIT